MGAERAYWLAWSQIPGIGPILLGRLQQHFGTLATAWEADPAQLGQVEGFGPQTVEVVATERSRLHPEQLLQQHEQENSNFWTPDEADYPRLLLEISSPPPLLYYCGEVQPKENQGVTPLVGIVGTRNTDLKKECDRW